MRSKSVTGDQSLYCDSKGRQYFYDNAKFILIILVVVVHFISPLKASRDNLHIFWRLVNNFHMPCMIFISGFFAKSYISKSGEIKVQRTFSYLIIYLAAQLVMTVYDYLILKEPVLFTIVQGRTSLWFLECLIIWYLVLPFFSKFNPRVLLPVSIAVGLIMGYDSYAFNELAIQRVIVHFPFFMAGYYCTPELIGKLFQKKYKVFAIAFIAAAVVLFKLCFDYYGDSVITCNYPYSKIDYMNDFNIALKWIPRAAFYLFAFGLGISFLALVPRRKTFFTVLGSRTLQVYILHRFLYFPWSQTDLWKIADKGNIGVLLTAVFAIALVFVLSLKPFSYPFNALQKIKIKPMLDKSKV